MKLPNWFKIVWWCVLLLILTYGVLVRFDAFKMGDVTGMDALVLLVWLALALVPIFKEVELFGLKFRQEKETLNPQPKQNTEKDEATRLSNRQVHDILGNLEDQLTIEQVNILKSTINELNPSAEEREELLFRLVAQSQIAATFEQTYMVIFGSQIGALQYLNGMMGVPSKYTVLSSFYENAKEKYPEFYKNYTFESWLGFLTTSILVRIDNENIGITVRGQAFLNYVAGKRYSVDKVG